MSEIEQHFGVLSHKRRQVLTGNQVGEILSRHSRGEGKRRIAEAMQISTKTVTRYVRMSSDEASAARAQDQQKLQRASHLDEHRDLIEQLFWKVDGNCQNLREVLESEHNVTVSLRSLQWYCREKLNIRQKFNLARSVQARHNNRIETTPGQELQIDFGEKDVFVGDNVCRVHFFVATLGYSRRMHAVFYTFENMEAWLDGLEKTFLHFKGVPRYVICDNARALVFKASHAGQAPVYANNFKALCRYWGTRPVACRPGTPQHKGKVERSVQYIKESFLKEFRKFSSLQDIQEKFGLWEAGIAAKRDMMTADAVPIRFTPQGRFKKEAEALSPVSKPPITDYRLETRRVSAGGHISVDNQRFKVPDDLRNLMVDVLIGNSSVIVCHAGKTIIKLDKTADAAQPVTRVVEQEIMREIVQPSNMPMTPESILQRPLNIYEEAAK